jgi:hypothetical protein
METSARRAVQGMLAPVVVLFVRADSIYKTLPGVECYDEARDARTWPGGCPVVAHPPCRTWGQLSPFARPNPEEHALGPWAVEQVRKWGGVLEHPLRSKLWPACGLPKVGTAKDAFGGWTMGAPQWWWGHDCEKMTALYIVGCEPFDIPPVPFKLGEAEYVQSYSHACRRRKQMPHWKREHTPRYLAEWLVELARRCSKHNEKVEAPK